MPRKVRGRRKGARTKGYFYRTSHKVWCARQGNRFVPLTDESGERLRDKHAPEIVVKEAHARFLLARRRVRDDGGMTLWDLAQHYLAHIGRTKGAVATLESRADTFFDLCTGYSRKWRKSKAKPAAKDRIHIGFGKLAAVDFRPHHIHTWLDAHPKWGEGGNRMRLQAIKRMLNFGAESGLIEKNPLRGMKVPKSGARITCINPEQEQALLATARYPLRAAIKVLIRTGMRPGEFAKLTAAHINDFGQRMEFRFKAAEVKTRKDRVVRVVDPAIMELVRRGMRDHKSGPIFRNYLGKPHQVKSLSRAFLRAKDRATAKRIKFDADCCLYSCRHTYAKRVLTGYWTGKAISIEILAYTMGNSPQVCRANYLQWCDSYEQPLWDAVGVAPAPVV